MKVSPPYTLSFKLLKSTDAPEMLLDASSISPTLSMIIRFTLVVVSFKSITKAELNIESEKLKLI